MALHGACGRSGLSANGKLDAAAAARVDVGPASGPDVEPISPDTPSGPAPELTFSSSPLDFGTLPVFATAMPRTLTVTAHSQVTISAVGYGGGGLVINADNCLGKSMNASDSCTLQVSFTMFAAGEFSGDIEVVTGTWSAPGRAYDDPVTAFGLLEDAGRGSDGLGARADAADVGT
jgi:hypothetical protein